MTNTDEGDAVNSPTDGVESEEERRVNRDTPTNKSEESSFSATRSDDRGGGKGDKNSADDPILPSFIGKSRPEQAILLGQVLVTVGFLTGLVFLILVVTGIGYFGADPRIGLLASTVVVLLGLVLLTFLWLGRGLVQITGRYRRTNHSTDR